MPPATLVPSFNGNVTIALASDPGGGELGGALTVTAVNGVATFTGLTINVASAGYTSRGDQWRTDRRDHGPHQRGGRSGAAPGDL